MVQVLIATATKKLHYVTAMACIHLTMAQARAAIVGYQLSRGSGQAPK